MNSDYATTICEQKQLTLSAQDIVVSAEYRLLFNDK